QAEDGIRDFHVTGVQTCALPIYEIHTRENPNQESAGDDASKERQAGALAHPHPPSLHLDAQSETHQTVHRTNTGGILVPWRLCRSEERRVGKEGRSRG